MCSGWSNANNSQHDRQHFCREATEKKCKQKRGYNEHHDDSTEHEPAKRTKIIEPDDNTSPANVSADELLDRVSLSVLKRICAKVLDGANFKEELLSCNQDIISDSLNEARKEKSAIIKAARSTAYRVEEEARDRKGISQCEDWPRALFPFLSQIEALHSRGSLVSGPELAWEALIEVVPFCMYQWNGGHVSAQGDGEEDCDEFHDEVDRVMLVICEAQKQNGKVAWLLDGRREEVWDLQVRVDGEPCTYRYQETLEFLDQF
ncbi:hypothetical protein HD806DRAFT_508641 [Xylariaceae sp. AK1471]|nr:hypothetical protein HD806DRAFT_508641 [Xylariaceae sp. AK1471]